MALRLQGRGRGASTIERHKENAMLLRKLIVFAITGGLAKKAWDQVRKDQRRLPVDITEVIARPAATADPGQRRASRRLGARRRREGPSA
jgi:hypothetical protein